MTLIMEQGAAKADFQGTERRAAHRQRVLKGATLYFNKGFSAFECVVRNLSDGGARLSLAETFGLPNAFNLLIAGENTARVAQVVWRRRDAIGVSFGARQPLRD